MRALLPSFLPSFLLIMFLFFGSYIKAQFSFVAGSVNTPQTPSHDVGGVTVLMPTNFANGTSSLLSATTNFNGTSNSYFIPLPSGQSVSSAKIYVDLSVNQNYFGDLSCITTTDVVVIGNFITGSMSPDASQKVAADANLDGVVNVDDMIDVQRYILGYESSFNNSISVDGTTFNNVWAVFPTQADLNSISGPGLNVSYTSMYNYNPFPSNSLLGQFFIAIKLGDVNNCPTFF